MSVSQHYKSELAFIHELARGFAEANPATAGLLKERSSDPDVERLIEAFAFQAAGIRARMDSVMPDIVHGLAELLVERVLAGDEPVARDDVAAGLERAGIAVSGQRLAYILMAAEIDGLVCNGARDGKRFTYTRLERLAPAARAPIDREEALARLAATYFTSRGPATVHDFAWWSGLPIGEARRGAEAAGDALTREGAHLRARRGVLATAKEGVFLLPPFDEMLIAYRDRSALLDPAHVKRINAGGKRVIFEIKFVINRSAHRLRVAGTRRGDAAFKFTFLVDPELAGFIHHDIGEFSGKNFTRVHRCIGVHVINDIRRMTAFMFFNGVIHAVNDLSSLTERRISRADVQHTDSAASEIFGIIRIQNFKRDFTAAVRVAIVAGNEDQVPFDRSSGEKFFHLFDAGTQRVFTGRIFIRFRTQTFTFLINTLNDRDAERFTAGFHVSVKFQNIFA